jgi:hypothetical protein
MSGGGRPLPTTDSGDLADLLGPSLQRASAGRLGPIEWFHSPRQRGGAATGFSRWDDRGEGLPVLVKFPVSPGELRWTTALGSVPIEAWDERWALTLPTPRVLASGDTLDGYDAAWLVTERLASHPPPGGDYAALAEDLLRATADFQAAAMKVAPLDARPAAHDWEATVARSRQIAKAGGIPEAHRWQDALKRVQRALPILAFRWESRPVNAWCHGDVHPGNALRRVLPREVPDPDLVNRHGCVLIDLALVHCGHWAEDALYLERQFWGRREALGLLKPVPMLARLRRERGLPADDNYGDLAMARRVLAGACAPALLDREGHPKYLAEALATVERDLAQASR